MAGILEQELTVSSQATLPLPLAADTEKYLILTKRSAQKMWAFWKLPVQALTVLVLLESVLFLPAIQQKLDFCQVNPLPQKLETLQDRYAGLSSPASAAPLHAPIIEDSNKLKVLALGTSRTNNGFNTKAFANAFGHPVDVFNLGLPQAGYDVSHFLLKDYITKAGTPDVLFIEVSDFLLDKSQHTPEMYFRSVLLDDAACLMEFWSSSSYSFTEKWNISLSLVSNLHAYRKILEPNTLHRIVRGKVSDDTKNPDPDETGWQAAIHSDVAAGADHLWVNEKTFAPKDTQRLDQLIQSAREKGIQVVLVKWPDNTDYRNLALKHPLGQAFDKAVDQIGQRHQVPVVDLNDATTTGNNFIDSRHLNPEGSQRASAYLAETVKNKIKLPD